MRQISDELKKMILLTRYHDAQPASQHPTYRSCKSIADVIGVTKNQVDHVCKQYFRTRFPPPRVKGAFNV